MSKMLDPMQLMYYICLMPVIMTGIKACCCIDAGLQYFGPIVKQSGASISIFTFFLSWRCKEFCLSCRYVLLTRFEGEACTWCLTSAGLSFGILAAACSGFSRRSAQCMLLSLHACTALAPCSLLGRAFQVACLNIGNCTCTQELPEHALSLVLQASTRTNLRFLV